MDLTQLPPYQKRAFVPQQADLTDVKTVAGLYGQLEQRPIGSDKEFERWILDRSELDAALSQAGSILYIRMTCQTDDKAAAGAYATFIQTVSPAVKPINDRINRRHLEYARQFALDAKRYEVYDRAVNTDVELFVQKNVDLQTQVDLISQEYQTVCAAMTVSFDGKEQTLPQMGKYLLEIDRALREKAWRATAERRSKDKDKLEDVFDRMFKLRNEISRNAGFSNFTEYQFKSYHRFDYTPQDCKRYHETVEQFIVPLNGKIMERRRKEMKLKSLRPWDTVVDPLGRAALKPFDEVKELIEGTKKIFNQIDPQLGKQFKEMDDLLLLDLESRKGKAPGGYQNTLSEARKPFIFMNAVGVDDDVRTLLHEGGHAFHALACAGNPLVDYRHAPMEFCEVASMAMELLGGRHIDVFYGREQTKRSNREHLEGIIHVLAWVANIDAFQHWMYEHPNHSPQERAQAWLGFYEQFGGKFIDWTDLDDVKAYLWHRQLHIFEVPFYYIEYGIAQLGALQVWMNARRNPQKALADYRRGLALGGSRPLPELYKAAGIKFDFSADIIKPLIEAVTEEWETVS
ncbi:MAG: M3 family oligoendopeptidase [Candidatus Omnitrophica bacterium]|nr:M3 family oligoendopeptidase [Candidatus Omnitrophota bacterium]